MANTTLHFNLKAKVDGSGDVKKLTVDLDSLGKAVDKAQKGLSKPLNLAAISVMADQFGSAISGLTQSMGGLVNAYQAQVQAETQLETVMRQRMGATEAEIQSIKDLASAQQELGIIGDEVQLAGAQQMATFLNSKKALETLMPAMNNLVAQQKGYNATAQDAVTIGNLFGKAMQGQTSALRRVGITFTQAEEQALKMANEEDRAAILAQIITNNVGNMNQELAKTPTGQLKQLTNYMGDLQEQIGGMIAPLMPAVTGFNQLVAAGTGLIKVVTALKGAMTGLVGTCGLIVAAVAGVAAGVYSVIRSFKEFNYEIDTAAVKQQTLNQLYGEATAKAQVQMNALQDLIDVASDETRSMDERKAAMDKANSVVPGFNANIDETTKKLNYSTEALKSYNEALKNKYLLEGAKTLYAQLGQEYATALYQEEEARKAFEETKKNKSARQGVNFMSGGTTGINMNAAVNIADSMNQTAERDYNNKVKARKTVETKMSTASDLMNKALTQAQEVITVVEDGVPNTAGAVAAASKTGKGGGGRAATRAAKPKYGEAKRYDSGITSGIPGLMSLGSIGVTTNLTGLAPQSLPTQYIDEWNSSNIEVLQSLNAIDVALSRLKAFRAAAGQEDLAMWDKQIKFVESYRDAFNGTTDVIAESQKQWGMVADAVSNVGSIFGSLGSAIKGTAGEWLKWMGNVLSSVTQLIPAILAITNANKANAMSGAISSAMQLPPPFNYITLAANIAAVIAAFAQIPAFAEGGIAFGPTMGVFGEYAGARTNPEVVAPLDKLRSMIDGGSGGEVEFRISGDTLVGVLNRRTRKMSRV